MKSYRNISLYLKKIIEEEGSGPGCIVIDTFHGELLSGGLESPVIFLLDIDCFDDIESRMLNYNGMSRAKSLLYLFYKKDTEKEMNNMVSSFAGLLKMIKD